MSFELCSHRNRYYTVHHNISSVAPTMTQQPLVWLLWALLIAWLMGSVASRSVDHTDLVIHTFSSLQTISSGDSLPPYPEGIELKLMCQTAARTTYWYERRSPDAVPDKLTSISSTPVLGVSQSVFTIPRLERKDDGRELWCMMDSSSVKKVVNLTVVGPPSPPEIKYIKKGDGLELQCSSWKVNHNLELCWYRGDERLQCKFLEENEGPPTIVTTQISGDDMVKEVTLVCKARLKEVRAIETLTKETHDHFTAMLKGASVELKILGRELASCRDDEPRSTSPGIKTFTLRDPDNSLCRQVVITEHRSTPTAPSTTPMATTTTSAFNDVKEIPLNETGGSAIAVATLPLLLTLALVVLL